jgi:hypothetical protein
VQVEPAVDVIWFYERDGRHLLCEIGRPRDFEYEMTVTFPDGRRQSERFTSPSTLIQRSLAVQSQLKRERWRPVPEGVLAPRLEWVA